MLAPDGSRTSELSNIATVLHKPPLTRNWPRVWKSKSIVKGLPSRMREETRAPLVGVLLVYYKI